MAKWFFQAESKYRQRGKNVGGVVRQRGMKSGDRKWHQAALASKAQKRRRVNENNALLQKRR
jgi:hypothetical protein